MARPTLEVADIFRARGPAWRRANAGHVSLGQLKVMSAIERCRTAALGGHVARCEKCAHEHVAYNSCRNRHCPKCQGAAATDWLVARQAELLPVPYFHVVFTIPSCLHEIFLANPRVAYNLLFTTAAETMQEVAANPKNLGAEIGMTAVLHTWTQCLLYHPHLHLIVPGGGLDPSRCRWIPTRKDFLLSVHILSTVFRGKLLAAIEEAVASGTIKACVGGGVRVASLLRRAARPRWVVYAKPPFAGPEQVLTYLGRYTHRIAISNDRILGLRDGAVRFRWRDYQDDNRNKVMTLSATEFLRRFLLHVLPSGFMRIRHFGLPANRHRKAKLERCRELLHVKAPKEKLAETAVVMMERLTGKDLTACRVCEQGTMRITEQLPPIPLTRPVAVPILDSS